MRKEPLLATGLLAGTIIGAGIFSLPYLVSRVGLVAGVIYLAVFTGVYGAIHLMYARVAERQPGEHQFFYLARRYLPHHISRFASVTILLELSLVLVVYLILAPTFSAIAFGWGGTVALLAFWAVSSVFIFMKLSWLGAAESLGAVSILAIVAIVFIVAAGRPLVTPVFQAIDWPTLFLPFGPLLFSLAGRPAVSKVVEEHHKAKAAGHGFSISKVIMWGTVIPAIVYLTFVVGILRLNPSVSPEALDSLGALSPGLASLLGLMGLLTLWSSYFIIGANVKDILHIDLHISKWLSGAAVLAVPLLFYAIGFQSFLGALGFVGGIFLALEGIFVVAMWRRAFPASRWRWLSWPLFAVFAAAIVYEIATLVL